MITHRPYVYPCATPEEARQSLVVLERRRDQGLVTTDDYRETRRQLVRAVLELKADGDSNREAADILGLEETADGRDVAANAPSVDTTVEILAVGEAIAPPNDEAAKHGGKNGESREEMKPVAEEEMPSEESWQRAAPELGLDSGSTNAQHEEIARLKAQIAKLEAIVKQQGVRIAKLEARPHRRSKGKGTR
jgi:hypothetical protein